MSLPPIVSRQEWEAARKAFLVKEKDFTHRRDALSTERRELPMVEVDKDYVFEGPDGRANLADLFEGRRQLIVCHFMFDPSWDDGCPSCTAGADEMSKGHLDHLHASDTTLAYVSRAPLTKIENYKRRRGWTFPWYSSFGSDFNYDFHVTLDEKVAPVEYNYRTHADFQERGATLFTENGASVEYPGRSEFLHVDGRIFHTYSVYARGTESIGGSYYLLDETVLGRQEEWEQPKGRVESAHTAQPDFAAERPAT